MNPLLALAALCLLLLYLYRYAYSRPDNFPPGPPRLPLLGSYLQLLLGNYWYPYKIIDRLTERYKSKVLGFYLGEFPVVAACDQEGVREILARPEFQGRFDNVLTRTRAFDRQLGVFFVDGPFWAEQRRFALRHMRDFGFGRRLPALEDETRCELADLVEVMRGHRLDKEVYRDGLVRVPDVFYPGFINSILVVLAGARLPRERDPALRRTGRAVMLFQRAFDTTGGFYVQRPWLRFLAPGLTGHRDNVFSAKHLHEIFKEVIGEHRSSFSEEHMRDFCDIYLREMKKRHEEYGPDATTFSDEQLVMSMVDFFFPAATAISTTLAFTFIHLMHHPEVQRRVQAELDRVVGRGRLPSLDDRQLLPYTEATLRESMRRTTLTPISIPHRATEATTFRGYSVPKDAMMVTCLWSMHMDKDFWGDPENFRPERFLDDSGQLNKKDYTLPFGAGKRLCAGETFARQNLFVFFAAVMQNFTLEMPEGVPLPPMDGANVPGIIESPRDYWVRAVPRD